ncbi:ATP-grasp domain-containing protein (plasmid) [Streptomyces sp. NBC_01420]|uniref:ATP-grasp domain-containing protein n=1 Tax=Streptomyces sp. NBC_01420 TaxID=2903858 RepID=UPI002F9173D6
MTPPSLLLVGGAGPAPLGIDIAVMAIEQARARGLAVHIIGHAEDLAATRDAVDLADSAEAVDFEDSEAAVAWALDRSRRGEGFDVVFTCRELALPATARIAQALELPGNSPQAIDLIRSKADCRHRLADEGFKQPASHHCTSADQARRVLEGLPGPWVVKPRTGSGSEGVSLVQSPTGLLRALSHLPSESSRDFLVESYVSGAEYSVEGLFRGGEPHILAITAKEKLPPPFFVEQAHTLPAPLPPPLRQRIEETVTEALRVLGLSHGLFHTELWVTDDGIVLGEFHARLGGDYIHRLLAHAIEGLEMFGEVYDDSLGRDTPAAPRHCTRAGATRYFSPPPGRLRDVHGWQEAARHPAVLAAELAVAPGEHVAATDESDGRAGALAVGAADPEQARALAIRLTDGVSFDIEHEETP